MRVLVDENIDVELSPEEIEDLLKDLPSIIRELEEQKQTEGA